ncbi:hypothetical protein [Paraliobacillus ryukyuensis]|uniref:hypothetical protein n=1 Tax=Paraliobacillus ryukyuensis TaxID=200904 RepID=UPI0009A6D3E5|nr:hypothetical protein [Paraliobacillus ryukyuensis]
MKQILRSFALGLLTATVLLGVFYMLDNDKELKDNQTGTLSTEEMKQELEAQGYTVEGIAEQQPEEENTADQKQKDQDQENDNEETSPSEEQQTPPKEIRIYSLHIESGMTISEIAGVLANASIIEDENALISFLNKNDYATSIQIGTFELTSEMSIDEIAATITGHND